MIRLSVSELETYRRYKQREDINLAECLAQLRKEAEPSPAMLAGRALHRILETAAYDEPDAQNPFDVGGRVSVECDGFKFYFECDAEVAVPAIRELKGEVEIQTPSGLVTLVGVVDAMDSAIYDYKLTGRFDAERFADSYQWRCYLYMFNAGRFVYRVFVANEADDWGREWTIREYHELTMYSYPHMDADVIAEVSEFAEFLIQTNLRKAA